MGFKNIKIKGSHKLRKMEFQLKKNSCHCLRKVVK